MRFKVPVDSYKHEIKKCLADTFYNHKKWIEQDGPSITEILESYPRLQDYNGGMVCEIQNFF